jgi:hypothetical protein
VIKPKPLQSPVEGGFTVDDFAVDEDNQTVTCPNGNTRPISATRVATFGALCRDCPLRTQCTTSKTGRKIVLHDRDDLLRQARRDWKDNPDLRERYRRHRPNIERVVSQIASRGGRRLKLRYRGTTNNNAWLKRRTAALNLRNLINRGPGLHPRIGPRHHLRPREGANPTPATTAGPRAPRVHSHDHRSSHPPGRRRQPVAPKPP